MPPSSVVPSSSLPGPSLPPQKSEDKEQPKKSGKADIKGKKKLTSAKAENANHDKVDTSWEYEPPEGAVLINTRDEDAGEFDWDAVNNDSDIELWLIRVPESVCGSFLLYFNATTNEHILRSNLNIWQTLLSIHHHRRPAHALVH